MEIFIHRENRDFGPYTLEDAQRQLDSGELIPEDHAWFVGASDWMPLINVPGIVTPVAEPESMPPKSHTGLPEWIPPRRTDRPDLTSTTSFATPAPRPLGIRKIPSTLDQPAVRIVPASPRATPHAAEPIRSAPTIRPMTSLTDEDETDVPPEAGPARNLRPIGLRNMVVGFLCFVGGIVITVLAYNGTIAQGHAGIYLLTGGAMIAGIIQVLRGLVQYRKP